MRINTPVTSVETAVPDGKFIYSRTDLEGRITAANDLFVELSGFSRAELIGQLHNIVRHPDMPAEAFEDLWQTVKRGDPWSGYVKNRRRDGGYYWVHAFASPIRENGTIVGYESVRRFVCRETVEKLEAGYAQLRAGDGQVRSSVTGVSAVKGALEAIRNSATRSLSLINEIQVASREEASAAGEIARNVDQMAQMAEQSAQAVEEIADTAETLARVAQTLNETLARVKV